MYFFFLKIDLNVRGVPFQMLRGSMGGGGGMTADVRYMLLDSAFRDRYLYPEPSSYTVPFQRAMGTNLQSAVNPTTGEYPAFNFQWTTRYLSSSSEYYNTNYFSGTIVGGSPQQPVLDSSIDTLIGINNQNMNVTSMQATGCLNQVKFFYDTTTVPTDTSSYYVVQRYDPITRTATLDRAISSFVVGASFVLYNDSSRALVLLQGWQFDSFNATSVSTILTSVSPSYKNNTGFFITASSTLYLWDVTINEVVQVMYNGSGYVAVVTASNNGVFTPSAFSSAWSVTDSYLLFINKPPTRTNLFQQLTTTPATFSLTISAYGVITAVIITNPGSGYLIAPTLTAVDSASAPDRFAVITCTIDLTGAVDSVTIMDGGYGYVAATTSMVATAYVMPNTIYEWTILDPGSGFFLNDYVSVFPSCVTVLPESSEQLPKSLAILRVTSVSSMGGIESMEVVWPGYNYTCSNQYQIQLLPGTPARQVRQQLARIQLTQVVPYVEILSTSSIDKGGYLMPLVCTQMFRTTLDGFLQISPTNSLPPTIYRQGMSFPTRLQTETNDNAFYGVFTIVKVFSMTSATANLYGLQLSASNVELLTRLNFILFPVNPLMLPMSASYAILSYRSDGVNSLNYSGSTVSSNQQVCYQMRIVSLILPNQILNTSTGGLTSTYPFLFVEISNDTSPNGHNRNLIYSNNPNSTTATFSCHISDINSPAVTNFIKIWSDGSHQTLKFRPNDNIRVRVFLPDGEDFNTVLTDRMPPLQVNPLLQISILVEIIRVG